METKNMGIGPSDKKKLKLITIATDGTGNVNHSDSEAKSMWNLAEFNKNKYRWCSSVLLCTHDKFGFEGKR